MKNLTLITVLFITSQIAVSQNTDKNGDISGYKLKGNVKEIISKNYEAKSMFGEIEKGDLRSMNITKFGANNIKIETSYYDANSKFVSKDTFIYDSKGHLIEQYNTKTKEDWEKWSYNDAGLLVEHIVYSTQGSIKDWWKYVYEAKGREIESNYYNSDGSLYSKGKAKFDSNGNRIEYCDYKSDGQLDYKGTFKYDSNGNLIEVSWINADGSYRNSNSGTTVSKETYKYDSYGNCIEERYFNTKGVVFEKDVKKYNSQGKWIESKSYHCEDCEPWSIWTNKFDKFGNRIEYNRIYMPSDSKTCTFLIEYDSIGNWIKYVYLPDGKPTSLGYDERIIKY